VEFCVASTAGDRPVISAAAVSVTLGDPFGRDLTPKLTIHPRGSSMPNPKGFSMSYDDVIMGRRSIRGYKPDPVPRALIEEVIALAMRAPSSMNTQPWNFYIITGEPLDRIRAGNTERNLAGVPQSREFRFGAAFTGQHRDRQVAVAKQLFGAGLRDRHL
jgi:hypothetical protein